MAISEENVNNVDIVGSQSYLASTSTIKKGSNDIAFIKILSWTNGALQTQTIQLVEDAPEPKLGEAKFSIPSDQLIIEAIQQLEVDTNATPNSYQIDKTEYYLANLDERNYAIKHINRLMTEPILKTGDEEETTPTTPTPPSPPSPPPSPEPEEPEA